MEVQSDRIHNDGTIAGGQGTTTLQTRGDVDNYNRITSANNLVITIRSGELYNQGKVAATKELTVNAAQVRNMAGKTLFSGGDMTLNVSNEIKNERRGEIFSQGNLTMQGRAGGRVGKIDNYIGKIEAMGDITCRANYLENRGEVSGGYYTTTSYPNSCHGTWAESDWTLVSSTYGDTEDRAWFDYVFDEHSRRHGWSGSKFYLTKENNVVSTMRTDQAFIKARGALTLDIGSRAENYGSVILAGGHIYGRGSISNITPSKVVTIDEGYTYRKT